DWTIVYASVLTDGPADGALAVLPEGARRRMSERIARERGGVDGPGRDGCSTQPQQRWDNRLDADQRKDPDGHESYL
ncbi:MAG TPA: hypothetical protein VK606_12330, partial [Verrucomicrobiae bacterium]|nr:hypothetical protein [Verrucomicrobiae bacterium]